MTKKYLLIFVLLGIWSCNERKFIQADDQMIADADSHPGEWLTHGLNYSEDRYSLLTEITKENVQELGLAWSTSLDSKRGLEATPLVADGVIFKLALPPLQMTRS